MDTKNYTPVARSKIHTCAKFGVDCLNGATCIVNITDKQTDKQMKGQSEIAYLPKFANMMLIVMVIVITEILYIILIFDCFENQ